MDDTIDSDDLDQQTLQEIKRVVEAYPVMSTDYNSLSEYQAGKHDAYSNVAAVLSQWLDED